MLIFFVQGSYICLSSVKAANIFTSKDLITKHIYEIALINLDVIRGL